jgi:hypothetical protein
MVKVSRLTPSLTPEVVSLECSSDSVYDLCHMYDSALNDSARFRFLRSPVLKFPHSEAASPRRCVGSPGFYVELSHCLMDPSRFRKVRVVLRYSHISTSKGRYELTRLSSLLGDS